MMLLPLPLAYRGVDREDLAAGRREREMRGGGG
jgi:hypothetical protein